ncbi:DUF397 domain-containing protein [Kitasatospora sp. NPDC094011]|uniref:DUF397 domain-containing protein n=1 Tax=Kitasatospora sp. NPDC094011 TaxID=3364090 RepID=UPI0037FD4849
MTQLTFKKSSYSAGDDNCVEVAASGEQNFIRDSKDSDGPALAFGREAHAAFIGAVSAGEFDFGLL